MNVQKAGCNKKSLQNNGGINMKSACVSYIVYESIKNYLLSMDQSNFTQESWELAKMQTLYLDVLWLVMFKPGWLGLIYEYDKYMKT